MSHNNSFSLFSYDKNYYMLISENKDDLVSKKLEKLNAIRVYLDNKHLKKAVSYLDKQEDHKALKQLNLALKDNPNNCFAFSLISSLYLKHNNPRQALKAIEKSIMIVGDVVFPGFFLDMSRAYRELSDFQQWVRYAIKAFEYDNHDKSAINQIVDYYYCQELYNEAAEYVDKAIEIDPNDAYFYHYRGCIDYERCDYSSALFYFRKALEINPEYLGPLAYIPAILLKIGKIKDAAYYQAKTLRIEHDRNEYEKITFQVREMLCVEAFDIYYEEIKKKTIRNKYRDRFMVELARMCALIKNYDEAALWSHKSFMISHDYDRIFDEAYYRYLDRNTKQAASLLELILVGDPNGKDNLLNELSIRVESDTNSEFIFLICDAIIKVFPDEAYAYYYRAYYEDLIGLHKEAILDFDCLLSLWNEDNAWAVLRRAISFDIIGDHEKAEKGYKAIIDSPAMENNFDELPLALLLLYGVDSLYTPLSNYSCGHKTKLNALQLLDEKIEEEQAEYDKLSDDIENLGVFHLRRAACKCRIGLVDDALDDVRWIIEHQAYSRFFMEHCFEILPLRESGAYQSLVSEFL